MAPTKWLSIAIMALLLNLAASTSRANLPRWETPADNHLDNPPTATPTPNLYRKCGGVGCGFGSELPPGAACGDCSRSSGFHDCGDYGQNGEGFPSGGCASGGFPSGGCASGDCGQSGGGCGESPNRGSVGGDCGQSGGGFPATGGCAGCGESPSGGCDGGYGTGGGIGLPPPFQLPFPWTTIPGFPYEPYQCCPSGSCGNSNGNCPRFTLHIVPDEPSTHVAEFPIPGITIDNSIYECCPRSCACENPFLCPGFTMYLNHDEPNMARPDMSPINPMIPAPPPLDD